MDGRLIRRWVAAGVIAAAGCHRNEVLPNPAADKAGGPDVSRFFGPRKPGPFGPPPEEVVTVPKKKPGAGLEPETELAFAETEVAAAFDGRPATARDQFVDSARQRYQKLLDKDPANKGALVGLAGLYAAAGDQEKAVAAYQAACRAYPKDHELAHKLAGVQVKYADFAGAAESCRAALALDPENRTYNKTLGYCQAVLGQWDDALASFRRVMPEAQARYFVGKVLADLDRPDDARQQMQYALQVDPQCEPAKEFLADGGKPVMPAPAPAGDVQPAGFTEPAGGGR